ncbi:3'(2'),5'-bisphosphate nucleotidase 1 isoform X9 [Homo sapiens]|uniref:3'(2'),5'-bisphosphate nucleotidase 1 isoform X9 n=1 Tax=Homo sapiens TaxID=9606 RepID=UPI0007DC7CD0|nr:3'(2'),5'-bisphosphate nucleotidase 1 isoform X9 [Homo sapiens]XP_047285580.1 3'(2'),5'-bisphosphate nucleotidase 1 isoform X9 [Homo sapiens]XP_054189800.1 3'(2'),5'-bisphosphate nucleotidase 1 isoform X9 [Homo sapiens]XP_054189801.1 3'(2'),5'-bisphosphate nucleotidase 1 isoform X9 [Homo sapiens]|eukprot:XP_016855534.1 3'(2'),5'-bisphosphate nucleotidase 1 isoform X10 [Homo sapiens]
MASSNTVLMRLVASAYSIAQKAGMIVRRVIAEGDLGIVEKTCATDLQTKADRLAQMSICSSLARKFPKLTIIGEEDLPSEEVDQELIEDSQWEEILKQPCPSQYSAIKEEDLVVWVDPLDGTKEYTEGLLDNVTVLIGIAYEGKAIAGVINQPYYNYEVLIPSALPNKHTTCLRVCFPGNPTCDLSIFHNNNTQGTALGQIR